MVKAILRWFELMSGLRINFSKSSVYGFNMSDRWVRGVAGVLHCGVGKTHFISLEMPIGGNPRCKKFWVSVVSKFCEKLAIWKSALLSFGGHLMLLNSEFFVGRIRGEKEDLVGKMGGYLLERMGHGKGECWQWGIEWRRGRMGREKDEEKGLWEVLGSVQLRKGLADSWQWRSNGDFRKQLLELIQVKSYFWIKNKVNGCVFPLAQWQSNPKECAMELKCYKRSLKLFTKHQKQHPSK
ncbi:hypothetical protein SLEP1_g24497 [Rubroshorea leprosula]|uniref:Uncharacterized protein n=1 Tax=Rubroshorea leprosula TaxID=152421 RepID=A0AAV5JJ13_9ROSI|nr:hypothetical protein SLEP1_g24497 [Rubroshorea leprosula]